VTNLYEETRVMANNSQRRAQDAYKESLSVYTDVTSIYISKVDISTTRVEVDRIKNDVISSSFSRYCLMFSNKLVSIVCIHVQSY